MITLKLLLWAVGIALWLKPRSTRIDLWDDLVDEDVSDWHDHFIVRYDRDPSTACWVQRGF